MTDLEIGQIAHLAEAILVNCNPADQVHHLTLDLIEAAFGEVTADQLRKLFERSNVSVE